MATLSGASGKIKTFQRNGLNLYLCIHAFHLGLYTGISDDAVQPKSLSYFITLQLETARGAELSDIVLCVAMDVAFFYKPIGCRNLYMVDEPHYQGTL